MRTGRRITLKSSIAGECLQLMIASATGSGTQVYGCQISSLFCGSSPKRLQIPGFPWNLQASNILAINLYNTRSFIPL